MQREVRVFLFRDKNRHVLLGLRRHGAEAGKWSGLGGIIGPSENLKPAAYREVSAQTGVAVHLNKPLGEICFHYAGEEDHLVTVYGTDRARGQPARTSEVTPEWFHVKHIPYGQMLDHYEAWLPFVVAHTHFGGEIWITADGRMAANEITTR